MSEFRRSLTFLVLVVALCGWWMGESEPGPVAPSTSASRVDADWWSCVSSSVTQGQPVIPLTEEQFLAILKSATIELSEARTPNEICWALEALGRSGGSGAVAKVRPFLSDQPWQVRAAAHLALIRLGEIRRGVLGLEDREQVVLYEDEREVGKSGRLLACQPVVLMTLKGLSEVEHDAGSVELLLAGLRARPIEEVAYDSTPEPFPDLVTRSCPSWYVTAVSHEVKRLGWSAMPALHRELEKPDELLVHLSGGNYRDHSGIIGRWRTVHDFCRSFTSAAAGR